MRYDNKLLIRAHQQLGMAKSDSIDESVLTFLLEGIVIKLSLSIDLVKVSNHCVTGWTNRLINKHKIFLKN